LSDLTDIQVNMVMSSLPVHSKKMQEIKTETHSDETLSVISRLFNQDGQIARGYAPPKLLSPGTIGIS